MKERERERGKNRLKFCLSRSRWENVAARSRKETGPSISPSFTQTQNIHTHTHAPSAISNVVVDDDYYYLVIIFIHVYANERIFWMSAKNNFWFWDANGNILISFLQYGRMKNRFCFSKDRDSNERRRFKEGRSFGARESLKLSISNECALGSCLNAFELCFILSLLLFMHNTTLTQIFTQWPTVFALNCYSATIHRDSMRKISLQTIRYFEIRIILHVCVLVCVC